MSSSSESSLSSSSDSSFSSGSLFSTSSSSSESQTSSSSSGDKDIPVGIRAGDVVTVDGFIPDMSNVSNKDNKFVVADVNDAGGGQNHHLEVYLLYRRVID